MNNTREYKKPNTKDLLDLLQQQAIEWNKEYPEAGLKAFIECRVAPCLTGWVMSDVETYINKVREEAVRSYHANITSSYGEFIENSSEESKKILETYLQSIKGQEK